MYQLRIYQNLEKFNTNVQNQNKVLIWKLKTNRSSWCDVYKKKMKLVLKLNVSKSFYNTKINYQKNKLKY